MQLSIVWIIEGRYSATLREREEKSKQTYAAFWRAAYLVRTECAAFIRAWRWSGGWK